MRQSYDNGHHCKPEIDGAQGMSAQQTILVFQQNNSAESKIQGIRKYGGDLFNIEVVSIAGPLPSIIDDAANYLPEEIRAGIVLDYLRHPDVSHDLAVLCSRSNVPVVASGKKHRVKGVLTPPT